MFIEPPRAQECPKLNPQKSNHPFISWRSILLKETGIPLSRSTIIHKPPFIYSPQRILRSPRILPTLRAQNDCKGNTPIPPKDRTTWNFPDYDPDYEFDQTAFTMSFIRGQSRLTDPGKYFTVIRT
ncbi:hypothetical protein TSUD_35850 [Trifolium subterraneum]|uniref:Uncharacterized protein n=1 Tax=Trifolium subterraneum TaxID=3900 RepID=A0A2Z6N6Q1_TRISU|nr:hypothetical protein TSUD_35850 [Trifolium subterraneum]